MSLALSIGLLAAAGVFLVLQRGMIRIILGFVLLTHAVNLLLIAAGGVARREAPFFGGDTSRAADPLPQAFVLTAIVIAFAITVVLATLAVVGRGDDDTEPDLHDPDLHDPDLHDPDLHDADLHDADTRADDGDAAEIAPGTREEAQ